MFLPDGLAANDAKTKAIIEDTNLKYGHADAERLVGDYIIISTEAESGGYQCRFEVRGLFGIYRDGGWGAVYQVITEHVSQAERVGKSSFSLTDNYDAICGRLIVCMRNLKNNALERKGLTYRQIDDMAIVLYAIALYSGDGNRLIVPVPRIIAQDWHKSDEDIFGAALRNTARLSPPRAFYSIDDMLGINKNGCDFMTSLKPVRKVPRNPYNVTVSALPTSDGAAAIFYPGVQQRLAELADGDYYVVFSGKDEVHIHRADGISPNLLKTHLVQMNLEFADTMLTQHIYRYDSATKVETPENSV